MSSTPLDALGPVASDNSYPRLLGDVGGTNARLALQLAAGSDPDHVRFLPTADFSGPRAAIEQYLRDLKKEPGLSAADLQPRWACLGVACPLQGDVVSMTNQSWTFSQRELKDALGLDRLLCLNDFTALAWSLPALKPEDLKQLGGREPVPGRAKALLGAGTGLGVSGLLPVRSAQGQVAGWVPLEGEGGHVTLSARDVREADVIAVLRERWDHVSAERVLSGMGLEAVYAALVMLSRRGGGSPSGERSAPEMLSAKDIAARGVSGECPVAAEAVDLFCAFLGTVAGNLALTLGSLGGVYVGGGIVPKLGAHFHQSRFRDRFEDKGRYRDYLGPIPVYVIHDGQAALRGAAAALDAGGGMEPEAAR